MAAGVQCYLCKEKEALYYSWKVLMNHLRKNHGVQHSSLKGTYFHTELNKECAAAEKARYHKRKQEAAAAEEATDAVEDEDEQGGADFVEKEEDEFSEEEGGEAQEALEGGEGEPEGEPVIHERGDGTLWKLVWVRVNENGEPLVPLQYEEMSENPPPLTVAEAGSSKDPPEAGSELAQVLSKVQSLETAFLASSDVEVACPEVTPAGLAFDWQHPAAKKRYKCPISDEPHPHFQDYDWKPFRAHLRKAGVRETESQSSTLLSITRFWNLLEISEGEFHPAGVLCGVYKENLLDQLQGCPVMDQKYGWARNIFTALDHWCEFLKAECSRRRWKEARSTLQQLQEDMLKGYKSEGQSIRKIADREKWATDAARLEKFPSSKELKKGVAKAMDELACISKMSAGQEDLSKNLQQAALTAVVFVVYYNSFAGRSGEWEAMLRQHVADQLDKGENHLVSDKHKTSDTYGRLAKYVPPGSWEAFQAYISLPGKKTDLFLEPSPGCPKVSVASHLRRGARLYLPQCDDPPNVNLIRKQFHTQLLRLCREDKCMDLLSKVDAHSAEVAKKVYCTTTISDDAKLGKLLFEALWGKPVDWPKVQVSPAKAAKICGALALLPLEDAPCPDVDLYEEDFILWQEELFPNLRLGVLADGAGEGDVLEQGDEPGEGNVLGQRDELVQDEQVREPAPLADVPEQGDEPVRDEPVREPEPPAKRVRGKASPFSATEQAFLEEEARKWGGSVPSVGYLKKFTKTEQEAGRLPLVHPLDGKPVDFENVRSFMTTYCKKKAKAD